jgi:4-hydroxybenzoate polyprenyltransferase
MLKRLWIYQRERFPLDSHGALIAAFSASAIAFSAFARHAALPDWRLLAAGFVSSLLFFLQMRIADEWKDAADDARFRPYRPVPRGLVTLRELGGVGIVAGVVQLAIALAVTPRLVPLLLGVWVYFALMSREFFVGAWLRAHPVAYIASHMAIVPMIDAYVSAFDWLVMRQPAPPALTWFLAVTFCNGLVVEIGRKLRAPDDEERGVETYSALWGRLRGAIVWCAACAATAGLATVAASRGSGMLDGGFFAVLLAAAVGCGVAYVREPNRRHAKRIENLSGAWTVILYLTLGLAPFAIKAVF